MLFEMQQKIGNKWCEIAKHLPGRTENAVKNRYNSSARRRWLKTNEQRQAARRQKEAEELAARQAAEATAAAVRAQQAANAAATHAAAQQAHANIQAAQRARQQQQQQGAGQPHAPRVQALYVTVAVLGPLPSPRVSTPATARVWRA